MKLFYWNKALLWKEWRQNSQRFWGLFVFMSLIQVICTIVILITGAISPDVWFNGGPYNASSWSEGIATMVNGGEGSFYMGIPVLILLMIVGVLIVAEERTHNSLDFLLATPVSRKEIISNKFLLGAIVIVAIMLFNFLFMAGLSILLPAQYSIAAVGEWFVLTTSVYLAVFALAMLAASISGNSRMAFITAIVFVYFPRILAEILGELFSAFGLHPGMSWIPCRETLIFWSNRFTLPYYIESYRYGQTNGWTVLLIILAAIIFYLLALKLFENNQQEKNGEALMLANSAEIIKVGTSFLVATFAAVFAAGVFSINGLPVLLLFALSYFLVSSLFSFVHRYA